MDRVNNWLERSASKGSTNWLRRFIYTNLEELEAGTITAQDFADRLDIEFARRSLDSPKKQKNYRSNVVQALKLVNPSHPAIELVTLSTETYRKLNDEQRERVARRETQFIHPDAVETLVTIADRLLDSEQWDEVAAGLTVLTGRRISEIVLSNFAMKSAWSLKFSNMMKKQQQDIIIEIPTLAPANRVLSAIEALQQLLRKELPEDAPSDWHTKRFVNNRYSAAIAIQCEQHFGGIVSTRYDRDKLYGHLFRAIYATIAAHWFCPPYIPEHLYKSEIQGHFSISQDGVKLPSYSARASYDDYAIGDGNHNRDGRLGIKLSVLPDVEILEVFQRETKSANQEMPDWATAAQEIEYIEAETEATEQAQKRETDSLPLYALYEADVDRMTRILARQGVRGTTADLFHILLKKYEQALAQQQPVSDQEVEEETEIEALRDYIFQLEQERDRVLQQQERQME